MARGNRLGHEARLDDHLGVRDERRRLGVSLRTEAEHGRRPSEPFGEIGKRRDADPAAHEQRPFHVEAKSVSERPEHVEALAADDAGQRLRPRSDRVDEEAELGAGREREAHRPGQQAPGRGEHEELTRDAGLEASPLDAEEPVGADVLDPDDVKQFSSQLAPEATGHPRFVPGRWPRRQRTHLRGS